MTAVGVCNPNSRMKVWATDAALSGHTAPLPFIAIVRNTLAKAQADLMLANWYGDDAAKITALKETIREAEIQLSILEEISYGIVRMELNYGGVK